ncbi:hypothetical protein [Mycolicibacterium porcinum]|uniref:hypothetical protein n=1 Tax=Mycolicibacterium porcinum TaxID=39693 RepID=UPI001041E5A2|nr:hypothetical protein [Mycolicibacterium porcinum]
MKRLIATVSSIAAALGLGVVVSSPVQAEPYGCPFDMTTDAGKQALDQSSANFTAQIRAINNAANDRPVDQREAFSKSPEGIAMMAQANQLVKDRDDQRKLCFDSLALQAPAPIDFNPGPLEQPIGQGVPQIDDTNMPESSSNVDCTKLRAAYDTLGPVTDNADAAAKLNHLKIPGLSLITGTSLALCGLDAVPHAIDNPSPDNQQRVFDGACGAIDNISNGIINPCGDTPVGSN